MAQATDFTLPADMAENAWFAPILVADINQSFAPPEGMSEAEYLDAQAAPYREDLSVFQQQQVRNQYALERTQATGQNIDVRMIGLSLRPDGTWIAYMKDRADYDNQLYKNRGAADAQASMLNEGESGNRYESYASTEPGEAGRFRVRERRDYAERVDPDKPIEQEIALGNGQSIYVLSNGKMVTGQSDLNWDDWDETANTHTIGNKEMVELPNGDIVEKSVDTAKGDVKIVETIPLEDGSRVAVFNDGSRQMIAGGKVSSVEIDQETGYVVSRDAQGNPTLRKPLYEPGIDYTDAGFNILSGPEGPISDLGLPETPATIETIGGQQFIRGTKGELTGLEGALDRAIDYAIITGQIDKARAWDDFRKRPDSLTVLEKAMEWAKTPGDQAFISQLHYMTSAQAAAAGEDALGQGAGVFNVAAQPSPFAQEAYQRFQDSITGGRMPTPEDFQASLAADSEPPAPTVKEQLEIDLAQAKLDAALAKTAREEELHEAAMLTNKAESEAKLQKLLDENERAGIAFENDQARREKEIEFKIGDTVTPTTTSGDGPPDTSGDGPPDTTGDGLPDTTGDGPPTSTEETPEQRAERERMERRNNEAAAQGQPRWVYNTDRKKYVYATAGWDIAQANLSSGGTLYLEASDPNAPAINLYDVADDGTGSGELKTVSDPVATESVVETGAESYLLYGKRGESVLVERGSLGEQNALAQGYSATKPVIEETGGVAFDDATPLTRDEVISNELNTKLAGVSDADQLADLVAYNQRSTPSGSVMGGGTMTTPEDDPLPTVLPAAVPPDRNPDPQEDSTGVGGAVVLGSGAFLNDPHPRGGSGIHQQSSVPSGRSTSNRIADILTSNPARDDPYAHVKAVANAAKSVGGWLGRNVFTSVAEKNQPKEVDPSAASVSDDMFKQWAWDYGEADGGITTGDRVTLVGESGPEIALFPDGTEIIPLDRDMKPDQKRRLRRRGIRGMQEGGLVFDREPSQGISQFTRGREVGPSQGRLFRRAGFTTPSAQALRNILPEELEEFRSMGARARIPEGAFERELAQGIASGTRRSNSARFLPLSLRS